MNDTIELAKKLIAFESITPAKQDIFDFLIKLFKEYGFETKQLNFNDTQLDKFGELSNSHKKRMRTISDDLKELKDGLFDNISNMSISKSKIDSIATLIGNNEKEKDLEVFNHFRNIQSICNEKQKKYFDEIMRDALSHNKKNMPKYPRGN